MRTGDSGFVALGFGAAASRSWSGSVRTQFVKFLVLTALVLCMSAPEELFFSQAENDLNPYAGTVKLTLLGFGIAILLVCRSRKQHWAIAGPFVMLMVWAIVSWVVTGAEVLPGRNLISSFGGIAVLAALCAVAEYLGGIRPLVHLMIWALLITVMVSISLGVLGFQPMPGESRLPGELEWFHGVGLPWYAVAGCAVLIAWVLASHLAGAGAWLEPAVLMLLIIPALAFLRAFLVGIVASILFAAIVGLSQVWRTHGRLRKQYAPRLKRLLLLATATLAIGAVIFTMKTSIREEGNELSGREIIWPIEIASIIQRPIFGLGPFGDVGLLRFEEDLPQVGAAHSDYLGAAVCYGLPGLVLFIGTLFVTWRRIWRFAPTTVEERVCRYAALLSMAAVLTAMIAENVIRDPRLFSLYLLFPALCLSLAARRQRVAL